MSNESEQTRALRKLLLKYGFYFIKIVQQGYTERGIPDLLGCVDGIFVGIEVKIKRERVILYTDHQRFHLMNIRIAGGIGVGVVYDPSRSPETRWALDMETTGETEHLTWVSFTGLAESVRSLPMKLGLTTELPQIRQRVGQQTGRESS